MSEHRQKARLQSSPVFVLLFLLVFFGVPRRSASSEPSIASFKFAPASNLESKARANLRALVQEMVQNEVKSEADDSTHWRFRKIDTKPSGSRTWDVIETKKGEVSRLIAVNNRPLDAQQQKTEQQRIAQFLSNASEQQKNKNSTSGDYKKEQALMKMLPDALLYTYDGRQGDLLRLNFKPNPRFHATNHEAEVFHHMTGMLVINTRKMRLAELRGRIASRVNFGYGLLGHLDKGGTFDVKQQDVGDGHWDVTLLDTEITGKALFFKSISVREKVVETDYRRVSDNLSLQQAANMLKTNTAQSAAAQTKNPSRGQPAASGPGPDAQLTRLPFAAH